MRPSRLFILGLAGLCAAGAVTQSQAQSMPNRRAGMWETTISGVDGGRQSMKMKTCANPATEHGSSAFTGPMGGGSTDRECSRHDAHPIPGGWAFESVCRHNGTTTSTSGTITGDFQTHYRMQMVSHGGGPDRHMTIDGRWLGPCPAGGGGRTITLPDGRVMTIPQYH